MDTVAHLLVRTLGRNGNIVLSLHDALLTSIINLGPPYALARAAILGQPVEAMGAVLGTNRHDVVSRLLAARLGPVLRSAGPHG